MIQQRIEFKADETTAKIICTFHNAQKAAAYVSHKLPKSLRTFDGSRNLWLINESALTNVVRFARLHGYQCDVNALPEKLIEKLREQKLVNGELEKNDTDGPYNTLFLLSTAPREVVQAVYRTLAKKYHPDTGGEEEKFIKIQLAYEKISRRFENG